MNELEKIYEEIESEMLIVKTRHEKFLEKGNKTAEADVRKALGRLKNLVTSYRKTSVLATKAMKA
jgi:hypothetical protein